MVYTYGNAKADNILIQMVDEHDLKLIESQVDKIKELTDKDFSLIAIKVKNWNNDLSPWEAPAVFGNEGFGGKALDTLPEVLKYTKDAGKTHYIGGYSLAALFAILAAYKTDIFSGVAAASPSVWFPGFTDYMKENKIKTGAVYLSLGDKEEKTKNPIMSTVADRIRETYDILKAQGVETTLEWNSGNHFKEPDIRTAKAFAWVLNH